MSENESERKRYGDLTSLIPKKKTVKEKSEKEMKKKPRKIAKRGRKRESYVSKQETQWIAETFSQALEESVKVMQQKRIKRKTTLGI